MPTPEEIRDGHIAALQARDEVIMQLREALEPFAKLGAKIHSTAPAEAALVLTTLDGGIIDTHNRVTVGDLRRATMVVA